LGITLLNLVVKYMKTIKADLEKYKRSVGIC
jgi:hypothetical protein